ncbi:MAG: N-6 DNA methylase, partial [Anaerolineales bacterium]|nr:N-6 DNA methylase [Anaerolineales bacterium]
HVPIERTDVVMQAKSYAWNSRDVFLAAITDFEGFRLYDATPKPDRRHPDVGLIFAYRCGEYLQPKVLDDLWLLSLESVAGASIDRLLKRSTVLARQKIPVDQAFLDDLTGWREQLAKAVFKHEPEISVADLNSVVQVFLDRLIFLRLAEDRGILPPRGLEDIARAWEHSGKRRSIRDGLNDLFREVNLRLNGEIFKPHRAEKIDWDGCADLVAKIIAGLYPPSPYRFDVIGVELLGSIYERYLGKTIRVTPTRAMVEDKPEVRKAGGVYYTPKYIVDYIVEQTVGKLIEGKTPRQTLKLRVLDPACGSGSFLLAAYQRLIDHHERWYADKARKKRARRTQPALLAEGEGGEYRLSLAQKAEIVRNCIYGVDIDPQAVEITMMSLYIKMLEGEKGAIAGRGVLPPLRDNIKCGNSLISHDIARQPDLRAAGELTPADLDRINPFDWESKSEGFGEIMEEGGFDVVISNPPYIRIQVMKEWAPFEVELYKKQYRAAGVGNYDIYVVFVEKGLSLL